MQATKTTAQCCGGVYALGKYLTFPNQDSRQATYLAPLASPRRSPAKRVRLGKEERGSGYGAAARKRGCGMERARSDAAPLSVSFRLHRLSFRAEKKAGGMPALRSINIGILTRSPAKINHRANASATIHQPHHVTKRLATIPHPAGGCVLIPAPQQHSVFAAKANIPQRFFTLRDVGCRIDFFIRSRPRT